MTHTPWNFFPKESMEKRMAAARLVALARRKMNDGGKHWVKNAFHKFKAFTYRGKSRQESCYCMVGGLNAASRELKEGRVAGDLALAKKMVASVILDMEVPTVKYSSYGSWSSYTAPTWRGAEDIIIGKNDDYRTTWQDVEYLLKTAAAALRRKPRV